MKKLAISIFAVTMFVVTTGFTTKSHSFYHNVSEPIVIIGADDWAGQVWVQEFSYGDGSRTVTDWHLMVTNITGVGHCLEGIIIVDGREIPVCNYVPASANSKSNAISIYHLSKKFSVKKNSFRSVEGWKCN